MDDVSGGSDGTPVVDLSDIVSAHSALDSLAEARCNFAATLLSEQQQFVASRDFLAERRREISEARDELSLARAELERRGAELQERERGLAQREAAIDASGTAEQLQKQLADLRAELDLTVLRTNGSDRSSSSTGTGRWPRLRRRSTR